MRGSKRLVVAVVVLVLGISRAMAEEEETLRVTGEITHESDGAMRGLEGAVIIAAKKIVCKTDEKTGVVTVTADAYYGEAVTAKDGTYAVNVPAKAEDDGDLEILAWKAGYEGVSGPLSRDNAAMKPRFNTWLVKIGEAKSRELVRGAGAKKPEEKKP